jgi:hypothetical protein
VVIDVHVATLLQEQLGVSLGLGTNATIFEICAAIDERGFSADAVLTLLQPILTAIVTAHLGTLSPQIAAALTALGFNSVIIPPLIPPIIASINVTQIVGNITANINASLTIFETCLNETNAENGLVAGSSIGAVQLPSIQQVAPPIQQLAEEIQQMNPTVPQIQEVSPTVPQIQQMNPTVPQINQVLPPSGDPMLQLQSTLSPIS